MNRSQTDALRLSNEESNRMTRKCLQTALIYLMQEKKLEDITVTELVRRSGVSRTAFYRNYNTKEDILKELSSKVFDRIQESLNNPYYIQNPRQWLIDYFTKAAENEALLCLLLKTDLSAGMPYGTSPLSKMFPPTDAQTCYTILALEAALFSVFRHWLLNGRKETPEEMADICINILTMEPNI